MRLLEAIIEANHRAAAGDSNAGLRPAEFTDSLPIVALTCIDPRLNRLFPQVLGLPEDQFIWLRNAGNIITGPLSSTLRSVALACAIKSGKEIAIIGHTDCAVGKTSTLQIIEKLRALGVDRQRLPENLAEFFGVFASERQNVMKAADIVRNSPLVGAGTPVHGLLVDTETGRLEWLVNGYDTQALPNSSWTNVTRSGGQAIDALTNFAEFKIGEMKFPESKIGEAALRAGEWVADKVKEQINPAAADETAAKQIAPPSPSVPPRIPIAASIRQKFQVRRPSE
jgi:carbonic anhydrase